MKKSLGLIYSGLLLLTTMAVANADTVPSVDTISLARMNWTKNLTLQKFDPSLGTLNSIDFVLSSYIEGSAKFESLDEEPATITMRWSADLTLQRPDHTVIAIVNPGKTIVDNVTEFDGDDDYLGPSGRTYLDLSSDVSEAYSSLASASDLALFTGPGTITLPIIAIGNSSGSGAGNLALRFSTYSGAKVAAFYNYTPVPEPSSLLVLAGGLVGMGGFIFRRRSA